MLKFIIITNKQNVTEKKKIKKSFIFFIILN